MRDGRKGLAVAAVIAALGTAGCPAQRLQNGRLTDFARFGRSVSIAGQTAAVGAYQEEGAANEQGAVYVYTRSGDVWNLQARLVASDGASGDQFGDKVALSSNGDTLAVSATLAHAPGAIRAGAVYVFQRSGSSWTQQAKLAPPSPEAWQAFGASLALDGNRLVVGSDGSRSGDGRRRRRRLRLHSHWLDVGRASEPLRTLTGGAGQVREQRRRRWQRGLRGGAAPGSGRAGRRGRGLRLRPERSRPGRSGRP